jgi:Tol biopolymer transport system component
MGQEGLPEELSSSEQSVVVEVIPPADMREKTTVSTITSPGKNSPVSSEPFVQMRFSKRIIWSGIITLVVVLGGLAAWKFGLYQRALDAYNTTSVTVKVKEDDKFALEGAAIALKGATYTTDANGKVTVARIVAGTYPVSITKEGYQPLTSTISIVRGDNDIKMFSLSKQVEKLYSLKGSLQDAITGENLVDVQVSTSGQTQRTNPAGEFTFDKLTVGDYKVTFSKTGYLDKEQTLTVKADDTAAASLKLTPSGQVVFVSNRDGKRAIYVSNYDGSNQRQLIAPANGGEDFAPSISPDGKWIVFSSTRDGLKTSYGSPASRLYIVGRDGKDLKKISDDVAQNSVTWSANSAYVYYEGYSDLQISQYVRKFYLVEKGTIFDLGEGSNVVFNTAGTGAAYVTTKDGQTALHTVSIATGERKDIIQKTASYFQNLAFDAKDAYVTYEAFIDNALRKYQVKLSDSTEQEKSNETADGRKYFPTPDGKQRVFIEERDGKRDLFLVTSEGKEKRLTTSGVVTQELMPRFDATGKYVVVGFKRQGENALYIVGLNAGDAQKIVDYYDDQSAPYTY